VTIKDIESFISRYTKHLSYEFDYGKFLQFVLPHNCKLRFFSVQKLTHDLPKRTRLNLSIEKQLSNLFKIAIETNKHLDIHKRAVREQSDFNIGGILCAIDQKQENSINEDNIKQYLIERNHKDVSELFIRYLDTNMNGMLSYTEFEDSLSPTLQKDSFMTPRTKHKEYEEITTATSYKKGLGESYYDLKVISKDNRYRSKDISKQIGVEELKAVVKEQLRIERKLEQQRITLALQPDFTIVAAYKEFDRERKCNVSIKEFKSQLESMNIYKPEADISLLYSRYADKNTMRYRDFSELVTPVDKKYAIILARRNFTREEIQELSANTKAILKEFFKASIESERVYEGIRTRLKLNPHFDLCQCLEVFELKSKSYIHLDDVKLF